MEVINMQETLQKEIQDYIDKRIKKEIGKRISNSKRKGKETKWKSM